MGKAVVDLTNSVETMYASMNKEKIIAAIDWIDKNTKVDWPFDYLRNIAIQELASRS